MTTLKKLEELIYKGFKETGERFKETGERFKETGERFKETDKRFKETDERFKETERLWRESWKESEERWKQTWRATDKRIERMHQQIMKELGGVTESLSRFSEQMVFPATKRLFSKRGIELNRLYANLEAHLNGDNMETDVIGLGPQCAVLIEVKLRLRQEDVEEFLAKKLRRFFDFFPSFRRPVLYGGVAGMSIDKGVDRFAYKQGLFVISQTGDNLRILNDKKFRPRSFAVTQDNRFPKRKTKPRRAPRA
ncbi:MAG: hypothetical protein ONB46_20150 [candidate division KSB1 bacterium]|nr:hypothetical protein [candidate division KSB1 bacterium]MDZ7368747.1 hypothetical protein [candidate division KSB1 bacterium]MDZ7406436.1 hypothetical protein [candidate division KSB1 bacterium]